MFGNVLARIGEYATGGGGSAMPMNPPPGNTAIWNIGQQLHSALNIVFNVALSLAAFVAIGLAIWIGFRLASAEDEGKRKEAKKQLLWAIIAVVGVIVLIVVFNIFLNVLTSPTSGLIPPTPPPTPPGP